MEWLASGLQICLGLVVSENLPPSLRNSHTTHTHTHTHTQSPSPPFPSILKLPVQAESVTISRKILHTDHV